MLQRLFWMLLGLGVLAGIVTFAVSRSPQPVAPSGQSTAPTSRPLPATSAVIGAVLSPQNDTLKVDQAQPQKTGAVAIPRTPPAPSGSNTLAVQETVTDIPAAKVPVPDQQQDTPHAAPTPSDPIKKAPSQSPVQVVSTPPLNPQVPPQQAPVGPTEKATPPPSHAEKKQSTQVTVVLPSRKQ